MFHSYFYDTYCKILTTKQVDENKNLLWVNVEEDEEGFAYNILWDKINDVYYAEFRGL